MANQIVRICAGLVFLALACPPAAATASPRAGTVAVEPGLARYSLVTNANTSPSGEHIWFTSDTRLDGRVHTNGEFSFVGQPFFGDTVSSVSGKAWYYNNGMPRELADDLNGTIDVPQFQLGFLRDAAPILLPANSYDQQEAALGLTPDGNAPSDATINACLGTGAGSSPPPEGIYLPHAGDYLVGGIYVQGGADQILASADTVNCRQTYRIVQGPTVATFVIDPAANVTSMTVGASATRRYAGVPRVLYVNGSVSDLRGPDRAGDLPPPAVLDGHQMLIVANGDLVLRRDMTAQNFDSGTAVLGVFSRGGGVRIGADAPNDMYLDAFVVAPAISGVFGVDGHNSGPPRGTFHLRGGCVESYYGLFGTFGASGALEHGYVRDFLHDGRGVVPPFYPAASPLVAAVAPSRGGPPALRLSAPHPNPAHESLRVSYALPRAGRVLLVLCDVQGRRVATLVDAVQLAGQHDAAWALGPSLGRQIRPGVYTLLLQSGGERSRVRVVLLE